MERADFIRTSKNKNQCRILQKLTRFVIWVLLCAELGSHSLYAAEPQKQLLLGAAPQFDQSTAYKRLLLLTHGARDYEKSRIDYLLERISHSPYNFIRNGITYDGLKAAQHLRWKYSRRVKEIATAEIFIDKIASRSRSSGEEYRMIDSNGKTIPLGEVLHQELELLDRAVEKKNLKEDGT